MMKQGMPQMPMTHPGKLQGGIKQKTAMSAGEMAPSSMPFPKSKMSDSMPAKQGKTKKDLIKKYLKKKAAGSPERFSSMSPKF